jgi:hypothetical protein
MQMLTFEGDRREFRSPPICCCCSTTVDPASPRESHTIDVGAPLGEADAREPIVVAACEPCQHHWTETSKGTKVGAALVGLSVLIVAIAFWKGRLTLLVGCLTLIVMVVVTGLLTQFVFRTKLDPACHSGPNGPIEAKQTGEGKLELRFWNPRFAGEFGRLNGASEDDLKKITEVES